MLPYVHPSGALFQESLTQLNELRTRERTIGRNFGSLEDITRMARYVQDFSTWLLTTTETLSAHDLSFPTFEPQLRAAISISNPDISTIVVQARPLMAAATIEEVVELLHIPVHEYNELKEENGFDADIMFLLAKSSNDIFIWFLFIMKIQAIMPERAIRNVLILTCYFVSHSVSRLIIQHITDHRLIAQQPPQHNINNTTHLITRDMSITGNSSVHLRNGNTENDENSLLKNQDDRLWINTLIEKAYENKYFTIVFLLFVVTAVALIVVLAEKYLPVHEYLPAKHY